MKKTWIAFFLVVLLALAGSWPAGAADFLGVPLPEGGRKVEETGRRLQMVYQEPVETVADFYRQAFKDDDTDINFRVKPGQVRVEDFGKRTWHAIVIAKQADKTVSVTVTKDSYVWILTMLVFRFLAVFVVLLTLFIVVSLATAIISRVSRRQSAET